MSGHYPARHNVHHIYRPEAQRDRMREEGVPPFLDPGVQTITRTLQSAGYRTGHFGKWHLGNVPEAPAPTEYGIEDYRVVTAGAGTEGWPERTIEEHWWGKSTDLFVDEAIRFIDEDRDSPFYINLWTLIPHATLDPTPEQLAVYDGLSTNRDDFEGWMREYFTRAENPDAQMKVWCASMTSLDSAIGRLLGHLEKIGLADDTIIFYTSDNGPEDYRVRNAANAGVGSPFRGRARKRSIYEGGVHVPAIARWPGKIPSGVVDTRSIIGSVDWFPTVCSWADVRIPDIEPDGEDISDILAGDARDRTSPLFWEWRCNVFGETEYHPPTLAVRDGPWKLFMNPDRSDLALYRIDHDPGELINRAEGEPEVTARLVESLDAWKATLPDRDPMYE